MPLKFDLSKPVPILIVGDGPPDNVLQTGLGRVTHDLAWLLSGMPEFQVGYLGRCAFGRARYPWTSYSFGPHEQWGEGRIQEAWRDLSQGHRGIIFTVWDASRLLWFANGHGTPLEAWLQSGEFERWGYFMLDGAGVVPNVLPAEQRYVLSQYDRVLTASEWGYRLATGCAKDLDWMPHFINRQTFCRRGREEIRSAWGIADGETVLGCVMTNQERKSWPVVMETVALLRNKLKPRLWIHPDKLVNYWDLNALAVEYGIGGIVICEGRSLSDSELAMRYSACDCTAVISGGEGFCYPVAESLSCGTPCVAGTYGAQYELVDGYCYTVAPRAFHVETRHNVRRAVYDATDVASAITAQLGARASVAEAVEHLDSSKLGVQWAKWFRKGLK